MVMNINKKISEKIKEKKLPDKIRGFLHDILVFELCHFEEKMPRFTAEYEQMIKKYVGKLED